VQPRTGQQPQAIGGAAAQAEHVGGLLMIEARKKSKLDQGGRLGIVLLELIERVVNVHNLVHAIVGNEKSLVQLAPCAASVLDSHLPSCRFDENPPHRLGSGRKEVARLFQ
jgi:hypothetical protein